jgi:hypothetical protein
MGEPILQLRGEGSIGSLLVSQCRLPTKAQSIFRSFSGQKGKQRHLSDPTPHYPWRKVFEAALLECNLAKLPERITEAQKVLAQRMQCLDGNVSEAEQQALLHARNLLCDLCKMAGLAEDRRDFNSQSQK